MQHQYDTYVANRDVDRYCTNPIGYSGLRQYLLSIQKSRQKIVEAKITGRNDTWQNDETKEFRVYLPKERIVITTQHVRNVETLNSDQNRSYRRSWSVKTLIFVVLY